MTGKELAQQTEELFNKRDKAAFRALHHPDVELVTPSGAILKGPDAAVSFGWSFIQGFPDGKLRNMTVIGEGDLIATELVMEGTNTGPLVDATGQMPTIPPTGKKVVIKGAGVFRVQDGLVREVRIYIDNMSLMAQLGLLPAPATA